MSNPQSGHACRMSCLQCDLSEILEETRPPDPELVDLIERAFLEGQIDGETMVLACYWLLEIVEITFVVKSKVRIFPPIRCIKKT